MFKSKKKKAKDAPVNIEQIDELLNNIKATSPSKERVLAKKPSLVITIDQRKSLNYLLDELTSIEEEDKKKRQASVGRILPIEEEEVIIMSFAIELVVDIPYNSTTTEASREEISKKIGFGFYRVERIDCTGDCIRYSVDLDEPKVTESPIQSRALHPHFLLHNLTYNLQLYGN
jgi:hypothetical protein